MPPKRVQKAPAESAAKKPRGKGKAKEKEEVVAEEACEAAVEDDGAASDFESDKQV